MASRSATKHLGAYLPYAVAATAVVAVAPLALVLWLSPPRFSLSPLASVGLSLVVSLLLARVGASLWKRHPGSADLVFDDLMLWGYVRRLRGQKDILKRAGQLELGARARRSLTRGEQTRNLKKLATALEAGDPYTHGHSTRVARHSFMIAKALKLPRRQRDKIQLAAIVHDVGKLEIPREVLNKPGPLNDDEYAIVKEHARLGADMVSILGDREVEDMVRFHHERLDGSGYPAGLSGNDIPIGARIIAVADTFDAITSRRPYRGASKHATAIGILKKEAGTRLDADVVRSFLSYYSGRRGVTRWSLVAAATRLFEIGFAGAARTGLTGLANAAVVGGAAVAMASGALTVDNHPAKPVKVVNVADEETSARGKPESDGKGSSADAGDDSVRGPGRSGEHRAKPKKPKKAKKPHPVKKAHPTKPTKPTTPAAAKEKPTKPEKTKGSSEGDEAVTTDDGTVTDPPADDGDAAPPAEDTDKTNGKPPKEEASPAPEEKVKPTPAPKPDHPKDD